MDLVDTKYVDAVLEGKSLLIKIEAGVIKGTLEIPVVDILKELAKKTDNKVDDTLVALLESALTN